MSSSSLPGVGRNRGQARGVTPKTSYCCSFPTEDLPMNATDAWRIIYEQTETYWKSTCVKSALAERLLREPHMHRGESTVSTVSRIS